MKDNQELRALIEKHLVTDTSVSPAMLPVVESILYIRKNRKFPVLILGESGTGKEFVARALAASNIQENKNGKVSIKQEDSDYICELCAAENDELARAEIFGYVEGAYTGATKKGSDGLLGSNYKTIFFDEIGKSTARFQHLLYRYIEYGEIRKVGSPNAEINKPIKNLIFAMLPDELKSGALRFDFQARISKPLILMPALRSRLFDMPILVQYFINGIIADHMLDKKVKYIEGLLLWFILSYDWPNNMRELRQFLERSVFDNDNGVIRLERALNFFYPRSFDVLYNVLASTDIQYDSTNALIGADIFGYYNKIIKSEKDIENLRKCNNDFGAWLYPVPSPRLKIPNLFDREKNDLCLALSAFLKPDNGLTKLYSIANIKNILSTLIEFWQIEKRDEEYGVRDLNKISTKPKNDKEWKEALCRVIKPGISQTEIAKKLNSSQPSISAKMRKFGISPAVKKKLKRKTSP